VLNGWRKAVAELLLELFSEEIPAKMQEQAAADLQRLFTLKLEHIGLVFTQVESYCAMRRLSLRVTGLESQLPPQKLEKKGPKIDANPAAIEGFCKSVGMELAQLELRLVGNSECYFAIQETAAIPTLSVLAHLITEMFSSFPWPKTMKWGKHNVSWIRPLKNVLALFDGAVLPLTLGSLQANNLTYGHRFLSDGAFVVEDWQSYSKILRDNFVVLERELSMQMIREKIAELTAQHDLLFKPDEQFLKEVVGLVEYPYPELGRIDASFMSLPEEVIITAMRSHQKYFATFNQTGQLQPYFIVVANKLGKEVISGNEKVLRARLSDAKFFYELDLRKTLTAYKSELGKVIYHNKLGTMADKTFRIAVLSEYLAEVIPGCSAKLAKRAAELCKADLVSQMVYEFPELQGIMGGYFALSGGEDEAVVVAIKSHYKPLGPGDSCPNTQEAIAVALADKIDSIVGMFLVGEKPSGSKDPFALRRAALGCIRIILENKLNVKLHDLFEYAISGYQIKQEAVFADLCEFFEDRFKHSLKASGMSHSIISAIVDLTAYDDLYHLQQKLEAVSKFCHLANAGQALNNFKRVINIVAQSGQEISGYPDPDLFTETEEILLHELWQKLLPIVPKLMASKTYDKAIEALATLTIPIEQFFDKVVVNSEDIAIKTNRLQLLTQLANLLKQIANFAVIEYN
jgi:glycyl-tRNA synthetase beta chain